MSLTDSLQIVEGVDAQLHVVVLELIHQDRHLIEVVSVTCECVCVVKKELTQR